MNKTLLALYGLKWNPFSPELPAEALFVRKRPGNTVFRRTATRALLFSPLVPCHS
jgi:hypothetical protein